MLLTKEVEIGLGGGNAKYYENLGYEIPREVSKYGKLVISKSLKLKVRVNDLKNNSVVKVYVKCDCEDCTTPITKPVVWQAYLKCVKDDGNYYCQKCGYKLFAKESELKTRIKNGKSLEEWCIENDRKDILDRWDYEKNKTTPKDITYKTSKKHWFKCPRGIHLSELRGTNHFVERNSIELSCKQCNSFAQWGIDNIDKDFLKIYWDYEKNMDNPWEVDYGSGKKVFIICQEKDYHESYLTSPYEFTIGNRCTFCSNSSGQIHEYDSLGYLYPMSLEIWSDKNIKTPFEYALKSHEKVWWKCLEGKHEDYFRRISDSTIQEFRCADCVQEREESFLQEKVRLYLNELGYEVLHEYDTLKCINPKTKRILPYDNQVEELKFILEVMGIQHYKVTGFHKKHAKRNNTTPEYELHMQQVRDRYKRIFAKKQGFFYIPIPYWTDNKQEEYKTLIDDKIKEILSKRR